jgi:hypothetical protein
MTYLNGFPSPTYAVSVRLKIGVFKITRCTGLARILTTRSSRGRAARGAKKKYAEKNNKSMGKPGINETTQKTRRRERGREEGAGKGRGRARERWPRGSWARRWAGGEGDWRSGANVIGGHPNQLFGASFTNVIDELPYLFLAPPPHQHAGMCKKTAGVADAQLFLHLQEKERAKESIPRENKRWETSRQREREEREGGRLNGAYGEQYLGVVIRLIL